MSRVVRALTLLLGLAVLVSTAASSATGASAAQPRAAGWRWTAHLHIHKLDPSGTGGLSCPSTRLCVAASDNRIVWSTSPTVASSWHNYELEPSSSPYLVGGTVGLYAIDCPTTHFCATVDDLGQVFTTTDPAGGTRAWKAVTVDNDEVAELTSISCAGPTVCAALAYTGTSFVLAHGAWRQVALVSHPAGFTDVSCPATTLCSAVEDNGYVYRIDPSGKRGWARTKVAHAGSGWSGISCTSARTCVASGGYDGSSALAVSHHATAGVWASFTTHKQDGGLNRVSCHQSLCLAIGGSRDLWTTGAASRASAWHGVTSPGSASQVEVACPSTRLCLVGTIAGDLVVGRR